MTGLRGFPSRVQGHHLCLNLLACAPLWGDRWLLSPPSLLRDRERAGCLYPRAAASALCAGAPCCGLVGGPEVLSHLSWGRVEEVPLSPPLIHIG